MRKLRLLNSEPYFAHWLRQRYIQILILTSLLMVDIVLTYLFIEVYHSAYEQNPFMAPVLELPYGYAIMALLKMMVILLVAGMSLRAYYGLHSEKHSKKAKSQARKLEVWLWLFMIGLATILAVMVIVFV